MDSVRTARNGESLAFGLSLTALQVLVYFAFIMAGCFYAQDLGMVVPGVGLPLSFVFGLAVIAWGTALTVFYVLRINAAPEEA